MFDEKTLRRLEYDKILEMLAHEAMSTPAKEKCRALRPLEDVYLLEKMQSETEEAFNRLIKQGDVPIGGLRQVRGMLLAAQKGAILEIGELLAIADTARSIAQTKAYGAEEVDVAPTPILEELFGSLGTYQSLQKEIERCILSEDTIDDHATKDLYSIRKEIVAVNAKVRSQLNDMIHSASYASLLQDPIVTVRGGRFCLPVKAEQRASVQGLIHDQSASGSTVFIEPMAVVVLNNRITELELEEKKEIQHILKTLSMLAAKSADEMLADWDTVVRIDFIYARAKLAMRMNAVRPAFNEEGILNLSHARHPLIDPKKVVPIHLRLGGEFTSLVITGPNTGGKTVSLKTLGLLTLMGLSGLFVPASSGARLPLVDAVFADIGDEQSIEQSLSTFSAHMVNISDILSKVTTGSLVLFDELGAGTDPVEGAALAGAILEYLRQMGTLCAATTHYSELKTYALSTEKVENASCEFNVETLQPTYRLMIGVPGRSNAFAISRRLGLSEVIIGKATELLEGNDIRFEEMMSQLEERRIAAEAEAERLRQLRIEISRMEKNAREQEDRLEERKEKILSEARSQARQILEHSKAEADMIIADMNKAIRSGANVNMGALERSRAALRVSASKMDEELRSQRGGRKGGAVEKNVLRQGTKVHLTTLDTDCIVLKEPDEKGNMMVRAGILQMRVNASDIAFVVNEQDQIEGKKIQQPPKTQKAKLSTVRAAGNTQTDHGTMSGSFGKSSQVSTSVDLRGMMTDEALEVLNKYLDDAYLAGLERVTVVHGKGTGALRAAVQQFLRKRPNIASYRLGTYGEGDNGVTIVEMGK